MPVPFTASLPQSRMHGHAPQVLHDALQRAEVRAIVIEVDPKPEPEEEFYAAKFET